MPAKARRIADAVHNGELYGLQLRSLQHELVVILSQPFRRRNSNGLMWQLTPSCHTKIPDMHSGYPPLETFFFRMIRRGNTSPDINFHL